MIRRLTALLALPLVLAAVAPAQDRVRLTARTDPPVVVPGGWVDVAIAYQVEPGWRFYSPTSPNGPRAKVEITGPKDWRRNSTLWTQPGFDRKHPTLGDTNDLGGIGGMRLRFHVPADAATGAHAFTTATTLVLCDDTQTLPEQRIELATSVQVAPTGERGPALRNLDAQTPLTAEEQALLAKNGFVVRARPEFASARSRDVVCVPLDILLEPGVHEDAINILCEPVEKRFIPLEGWRAFHASVGTADGKQSVVLREVLPLEFWNDGLSAERLTIPIEVTMRTTSEGNKGSRMTTQALKVEIRYDR